MCCVESLVSRRLYAGARTGTVDPWFSSLKTEDVALLRFVWCNLRWYGLTFDHTRCTVCVTLEKHLVTCHRRGEPESAWVHTADDAMVAALTSASGSWWDRCACSHWSYPCRQRWLFGIGVLCHVHFLSWQVLRWLKEWQTCRRIHIRPHLQDGGHQEADSWPSVR